MVSLPRINILYCLEAMPIIITSYLFNFLGFEWNHSVFEILIKHRRLLGVTFFSRGNLNSVLNNLRLHWHSHRCQHCVDSHLCCHPRIPEEKSSGSRNTVYFACCDNESNLPGRSCSALLSVPDSTPLGTSRRFEAKVQQTGHIR